MNMENEASSDDSDNQAWNCQACEACPDSDKLSLEKSTKTL